jgi:hypothetical protein
VDLGICLSAINLHYEHHLRSLLSADPLWMHVLRLVRDLQIPQAAIGAGAVRNWIWDLAHQRRPSLMSADIDVVYFDAQTLDAAHQLAWQTQLQNAMPEFTWEVVNQAGVHRWMNANNKTNLAGFQSVAQGIASWPETATCVAVYLDADEQIQVIAPYGLADLFELKLRPNLSCISNATFQQRLQEKRFLQRWEQLKLDPIITTI